MVKTVPAASRTAKDVKFSLAMSSRFSVALMDDDTISAFQKGLPGSFKVEEINSAIDIAARNSKQIRKLL